jgi:hypothetical protein
MPCGGIYPISGSWVESIEKPNIAPLLWCLHCNKPEPRPDFWCEEWDGGLHRDCIPAYLMGAEGRIIMDHGHMVFIPAKYS